MSQTGNTNPGPQGMPPWAGQNNSSVSGNVYATQGGSININTSQLSKRGLRTDTKALLIALPLNAILFLYGMLAYTGRNTTADDWRAGIFLFTFFTTVAMIGRWVRRRV